MLERKGMLTASVQRKMLKDGTTPGRDECTCGVRVEPSQPWPVLISITELELDKRQDVWFTVEEARLIVDGLLEAISIAEDRKHTKVKF